MKTLSHNCNFLKVSFCVFLVFFSGTISASDKSTGKRPNIVLILADDLGNADLACTGSDLYQTPNIDMFASEAMYFSQSYSAHPTCQPSRLAIQTGKYPARLGCVSHAALGGVTGGSVKIPKEEITIGQALQKAGYTTCHIGKWHIGLGDNVPSKRGYDFDIASNDFCCPVNYFYPYSKEEHRQNALAAVPDLEDRGPEDFLTEAITDEAVKFIEKEAANKMPFFLNMCYYAVHTPIQAEKDKVEKYDRLRREDAIHRNATYAGLVEHLDDGVGRILKAIKESGIEENTIVIFASDNGGETGMDITDNFPLKEGKGSQYEGGYRVPLFIKWPGVTKAGTTSDERVIGIDYYPTILKMAGVKGNRNHNRNVDGFDLTPILRNPDAKLANRSLHFLRYLSLIHYRPEDLTEKKRPCASIIKGDWKLLEFFELPTKKGYYRLYNIAKDPGELNDLSEEMPEKVKELLRASYDWRKSVDAPAYDMEGFYGAVSRNN